MLAFPSLSLERKLPLLISVFLVALAIGLTAAGFWGWTDDAFIGNYGDNSLLYFHQYQNALPGNPLADRAKVGTNINTLGRDPARLCAQL